MPAHENDTARRLSEGALILALFEHEKLGDGSLEREIVDRELRDLEQELRAHPGACERWLVPARKRRRR